MTPGHLRPVIDLERGSALSTSDLTDWVLAFVNEVTALKGPMPSRSCIQPPIMLKVS